MLSNLNVLLSRLKWRRHIVYSMLAVKATTILKIIISAHFSFYKHPQMHKKLLKFTDKLHVSIQLPERMLEMFATAIAIACFNISSFSKLNSLLEEWWIWIRIGLYLSFSPEILASSLLERYSFLTLKLPVKIKMCVTRISF